MGTFSVSLPEDEQRVLDEEAKKNDRSRAAQVRIILRDWFKLQIMEEDQRHRSQAARIRLPKEAA